MIIDTMDNAARYFVLGERLELAFNYLKDNDCTKLPAGTIPVLDDRVFALVQDNITKPRDQGAWEAHRKYIDVQYVVTGVEEMGYANVRTLTVTQPHDEKRDVAFFQGTGSFVVVPAGSFTIFFPEDAHLPGAAVDGRPVPVRKVVMKVAV